MSRKSRLELLIASSVLSIAFVSSPARAAGIAIDFEHYPGPDGILGTPDDVPTPVCSPPYGPVALLTNQYASVGITFSTGTLHCSADGHKISSTPPDAAFSVQVNRVSITSKSLWPATLTAYDSANSVLSEFVAPHPSPGSYVVEATLSVYSQVPIARITAQADTALHILNLDDLEFWPSNVSLFTALPCRLADTRNADGPLGGPALAAGAARSFTPAGVCALPATAQALALNVTVTQPTSAGHLQLFPGGTAPPSTSALNFGAGQTRANTAIVGIGADGSFAVRSGQTDGTVHVIVDVVGYFQ